jgi:hypothetical protein
LGSCEVTASGLTMTTRYYTGLTGGATSAQTACTNASGTWTAD